MSQSLIDAFLSRKKNAASGPRSEGISIYLGTLPSTPWTKKFIFCLRSSSE